MSWQRSGYYLTNDAHRGDRSKKEISDLPNACRNLKTNKPMREAPKIDVMKSKHTEATRPKSGEQDFDIFYFGV